MNLFSWYCINNAPSALQISFSLWMSQCEDLGSSDGLLNSLSFFSREGKSLISSLHSFNIQMSFGRPGLRAGGWKNFSINFIPADSRETHIARLHCTATSPQHVVLFLVLLLSCFSTQLLHAPRFSLLDKLFCWRKKSIAGKLWGNLSNVEVKGKRYCDLKNQTDELVFVLTIVALVVNEG